MRQVFCLLLLVVVGCGPSRDDLVKQLEAELKLLEHNEKELRQWNVAVLDATFEKMRALKKFENAADTNSVAKQREMEADISAMEEKQRQAKQAYRNSRDKVDAMKKRIAEIDGE